MNTSRQNNISKEDLYKKYLNTFSGIKFTLREIDIMSCVLHNRGNKKTADILSISYRTVETHIRNIIGKINKATRDDIIDFIEKSQVLSHFKTYYTWVITNYYFKNCLLKIASINQQPLHYAITDKMASAEDPAYSACTKKINKMQKDLKLANVILTVKYSDTNHYFTLKPEGTKGGHKKIVIIFDNNAGEEDSGIIYVDFRGNYYLSILNLIETLIPKAEVKGIIREFKDQFFNFQCSSEVTTTTNHSEKQKKQFHQYFSIKRLIILLGIICACFALYIFLKPIIQHNKDGNKLINSINQSEPLDISKPCINWNIPKQLEHYTHRKNLVEAVLLRLDKNKLKYPLVLSGFSGLAGVGKTTLAKHVINIPQKNYRFKGWFNAETESVLEAQYLQLGDQYGIFMTQESSKLKKINEVKAWLEEQKNILLVYDNVENMAMVEKYLPNLGHIIITSRHCNMPGKIDINVMEHEEAVTLLRKILNNDKYNNDPALKVLARTLGYLPLALSQAAAYIVNNHLSIKAYLSLYAEEKIKLLSEQDMPSMDDHKPAYISWDLNVEEMQRIEPQLSAKALELLDFISYCYPEDIPIKMITQQLYNSVDAWAILETNKVVKLLKQYSLVQSNPHLSIHRLVHDLLQHKANNKIIDKKLYFEKIITNLTKLYNYSFLIEKNGDLEFTKLLHPQIDMLLRHAELLLEAKDYVALIEIMGDINFKLGNYGQNMLLLEKALNIKKQYYQHDDINIAFTLRLFGWSKALSGDFQQSQKLLEEALNIQKKYYGNYHIEVSYTLRLMGWVEFILGNNYQGKLFLKNALDIQEKQYGNDHIEITATLRLLSAIEKNLGNYKKAKELLTKSLSTQKKYYDSDSQEIAYTLQFLGYMETALGNYHQSKQLLEEALRTQAKIYNDEHIEISFTMHVLAEAELGLKKLS